MKFNRIITIRDNDNIEVKINQIPLCLENSIFLLHFYEDNKDTRKRFTRNKLIQVDTHILTFRFCETVQFMEELNLFDLSNKQNKYFEIKEHQSIKNLQLIYESNKKIFISKSKAKSMYKIYNYLFTSYSNSYLFDKELILTDKEFTKILHKNEMLRK